MKKLMLIVPLLILTVGCTQVKKQVIKDIAIEDQQAVLEQYKDRSAWTRTILEDVGDGGSIQRDVKVKIIDVNMRFSGAVTIQSVKKHKKIVNSLDIERPLTVEKINMSMDDIFWFKDPILRQGMPFNRNNASVRREYPPQTAVPDRMTDSGSAGPPP